MISKAQIKFIRLLDQKKYRKKHLIFIAEGAKVAHEILKSPLKVHKIYATKQWLGQNTALYQDKHDIEVNELEEEEMKKISGLNTPQQVLLLVAIPLSPDSLKIKPGIALALESIRDPGNLGTIVRICDWYGIPQLFCSEDCADAYSPKTIQASMGSIARVEVIYSDITQLIDTNKTHTSYAATLEGETNIHSTDIHGNLLLIIGNEAHGISTELITKCDNSITIPRYGQAESLNASIAAAVLVDNLVRMSGK
jgi:RNA methyltransferase, TrmH family